MPNNKQPQSQPLSEKEAARQQLKDSIDQLSEGVDLRLKMQAEPLKLLGGASVVGSLLGLAIGSQIRRTKRIYVDAASPIKHQKGLIKAQQAQQGKGGKAILTALGTLAVKVLGDKTIAPKIEDMAHNLLEKAGQGISQLPKTSKGSPIKPTKLQNPNASTATVRPNKAAQNGKAQPNSSSSSAGSSTKSTVKALAQSSEIEQSELKNPNASRLNLD